MRLLLIDDELDCINVMRTVLKPAGHESDLFENPVEALESFRRELHDVVVTDYRMPEMNGIDVLKEIRRISPETPVVILTGYADVENAIGAVNNGAYAFFRKPLDFNEFIGTLAKIEKELEEKRKHAEYMEKLSREYYALKRAFESLRGMVDGLTPGRKEVGSDV